MANYGYGGGYTTTSHGGQGGADGGGFMSGSQAGSQDTPGGGKASGKDSMRPITVKQFIDAVVPHPNAEAKIDGSDINQLSVVGQVLKVSAQTTNTTFSIDDGTGTLDVKQWADPDADPGRLDSLPKEGDYVHVWGRVKDFNGKRNIVCHSIRVITDFNEISYHMLEATAVHLYFTRGPPEGLSGNVAAKGDGMFVDSYGGAPARAAPATGGGKLPGHISQTGRKVFKLLEETPQSNEGLHVANIAAQLKIPTNDVFKAGDELLQEGLIYTTIDDETWAVLEC